VLTDVQVIIVSWNVRDLLRRCLRSVLLDCDSAIEQPAQQIETRVTVVDSASTDGSADMVRSEFPQVELVVCDDNIGYVRANNLVLKTLIASGQRAESSATPQEPPRFAWLLNPDTVVHPGAAKALAGFMAAHPRCGLCGPKLVNPDGTLQHGAFALPGLTQLAIDTVPRLQARLRDTPLDGRYPAAKYDGPPFPVGTPLGAAMFARVEAIGQIGVLDEGYEMYSEEIDWAARMHKASWEVWCVPQAVVTHVGGASSAQASERAERLKWQSRQRYFSKHYGWLKRTLALQMVPARFRT
jgi:GT2 family glycosyltransferase